MKITTWNVNGYRAILNKGFVPWLEQHSPDVLCLQEVKTRPDQIPPEHQQVGGYSSIWNPAERPGYSGVATFVRQPALDVRLGLGQPEFDGEGRVISTRHPGFILFNVYFPNGQRGHDRVQYKLDFYRSLLEICDRLHQSGEQIVITGDFNTAHREIDLARPKANSTTSGFLPEERVWIDYFLEHGFSDAYRELYPERVEYTWWAYFSGARAKNIGWRLDYYLVSQSLMTKVQDVIIHADVNGSDHCPVSLLLNTPSVGEA